MRLRADKFRTGTVLEVKGTSNVGVLDFFNLNNFFFLGQLLSIWITPKIDAGYPVGFTKSVILDLKKMDENEPIIPDWLFQERSKVLSKFPYCPRDEYEVKRLIDKIGSFTGGKIMPIVLRSTGNIKSLFPLKNKVGHRSCVIYEGRGSCKLSYIEETKRNSEVRWKGHKDPTGKSEYAKHLIENLFSQVFLESIADCVFTFL